MNDAEQAGRAAEDSKWLDHAVRIGLVAYGVVHLLIGEPTLGWLLGRTSDDDSISMSSATVSTSRKALDLNSP